MEEIKSISNNYIQLFLDFTELLWNSNIVGKLILVIGIIGVAIIIAYKILNMIRGTRIWKSLYIHFLLY